MENELFDNKKIDEVYINIKELISNSRNKVYKTVIPRNVRLSEAPSYGMPITLFDTHSKGAKSYEKFAKEFMKNNEKGKEEASKPKHMKE